MLLEQCVLFGLSQVVGDHLLAHLLRGDLGHSAEFGLGIARFAEQGFDFGGVEVAGVDAEDRDVHRITAFTEMTGRASAWVTLPSLSRQPTCQTASQAPRSFKPA